MILLLLGVGACMLALPGLPGRVSQRLPGGECVPVAVASLIAGWVAVEFGLVLIALPTVAHALGFANIADACHEVLAPLTTAPAAVGWLAGAAAAVVGWRLVAGGRSARALARTARADPWLGTHAAHDDFTLVILPTDAPVAYGAPGDPPQVVVSQGVVDDLSTDALQAVVAHEVAHHRLKHCRYLALVRGIEHSVGGFGFVRRSTEAVRHAVEVWADDVATTYGAPRHALRGALAQLGGPAAHVQDRRNRLTGPPDPHPTPLRLLWYSPVAVLTGTAMLLVVDWLTAAHHAAALSSNCAG
ncbi:MAG: M56 family metallopeptidase [Acidimicrobiia bacterium]